MAWVRPQAEIEAALRDHPTVVAGVEHYAGILHDAAVGLARVRAFDKGTYADGIVVVSDGSGCWVVATAPHSWFVEAGTGIHGPKQAMILAATTTRSGWFKFTIEANGVEKTVVTQQHKGRPARHVMRDAAQQMAFLPGITWHPSPA